MITTGQDLRRQAQNIDPPCGRVHLPWTQRVAGPNSQEARLSGHRERCTEFPGLCAGRRIPEITFLQNHQLKNQFHFIKVSKFGPMKLWPKECNREARIGGGEAIKSNFVMLSLKIIFSLLLICEIKVCLNTLTQGKRCPQSRMLTSQLPYERCTPCATRW